MDHQCCQCDSARAHRRKVGSSRKRVSKVAGARDTLRGAGFGRGQEVDVLTFGQFSIIDMVEAVLEVTGPADVDISTWTAAEFDLSQIKAGLLRADIERLRLLIDRSFVTRHPQFLEVIRGQFGDDCVRTTRLHAKFVLVRNPDWDVTIRTSMNLNHNPRLEYVQVAADADLTEFYTQVVDQIFAEEEAGVLGSRTVPVLADSEPVQVSGGIRMGTVVRTGPGGGA